jgi:ATP-dependent Clp protease ATP-binding subunit ClpX
MLDIMFEIPDIPSVKEVIITEETVKGGPPVYVEGKKKKIKILIEYLFIDLFVV